MANDNLLIAAVSGVVALLASGAAILGSRARAALQTPSSSNGYRLVKRNDDGRYAVVGTD